VVRLNVKTSKETATPRGRGKDKGVLQISRPWSLGSVVSFPSGVGRKHHPNKTTTDKSFEEMKMFSGNTTPSRHLTTPTTTSIPPNSATSTWTVSTSGEGRKNIRNLMIITDEDLFTLWQTHTLKTVGNRTLMSVSGTNNRLTSRVHHPY